MKKYDFWELLKTELSVFANELFIYTYYEVLIFQINAVL